MPSATRLPDPLIQSGLLPPAAVATGEALFTGRRRLTVQTVNVSARSSRSAGRAIMIGARMHYQLSLGSAFVRAFARAIPSVRVGFPQPKGYRPGLRRCCRGGREIDDRRFGWRAFHDKSPESPRIPKTLHCGLRENWEISGIGWRTRVRERNTSVGGLRKPPAAEALGLLPRSKRQRPPARNRRPPFIPMSNSLEGEDTS